MRKAAHLREQSQVRRAQYENKLNELARAIDSVELIFGRRAASTGTLFGSVTTQQIADALLEKTGVDINRRRISQIPLREVGVHEVPVRLGTENPPILQINIMRQEDFDEMINAQQRAKAEAAAAAAEPVEELETIESHESIETTVAVETDVPAEEAATE